MIKKRNILILSVVVLAIAAGCSTTKTLSEGELQYYDSKVVVDNDPLEQFDVSQLTPYMKQSPNYYYIGHWNPLLYVYNWTKGTGSKWDRFVEKLGVAPVVYDSDLLKPTVDGMLNQLEYSGYFNSDVTVKEIERTTKKGEKKHQISTEYHVKLGKQYPLRKIDFYVDNPDLAAIMASDSANFSIAPGDPLSQKALENESERLAQLFRDNGYWGFSKNYFFYYADTTSFQNEAVMWTRIEDYTHNETPSAARPHRKYTIGSVNVLKGDGLKVTDRLVNRLNRLREGDIYREKDVKTTYSLLSSVPAFSSVSVNLSEKDSTTLDCRIALSPAKRRAVKLSFDGSINTNGLWGISPAISYSNKNFFHGGEVFSLGFKGDFQFNLKEDVRSIEFSVNSGLKFPTFLLLPDKIFKTVLPSTDVNLTYNYQDRPEYHRNIFSATYGYSWISSDKKNRYEVTPANVKVVNVGYMNPEFIQKIADPALLNSFDSHFVLGSRFNYFYTTDPSTHPKSTYFYLRGSLETAGNLLNLFHKQLKAEDYDTGEIFNLPYSQYVRTEISAVPTLRFGQNEEYSIAARLLMGFGLAYGNSSYLPYEQVFFAGGANSLRGWAARTVGPGASELSSAFSIPDQNGEMHLELNLELRFPIFWKLHGGVFLDAGNIWDITDRGDDKARFRFNNFLTTSALNWGIGLRADFDLILVRLDLGIQTYDPRKQHFVSPIDWFMEDAMSLHFGIGLPF